MNIFTNTLLLYALSLFNFLLIRIFLYLKYDFSDLTPMETLLSFLKGMQVDIITLNTFTGVFFLFLILPFKFSTNMKYRRTLSMLWFFTLSIMLIFFIGDVIYYGYVGRHMTKEILTLSHDTDFLAGSALTVYLPYTIGAFLFIGFTGYINSFNDVNGYYYTMVTHDGFVSYDLKEVLRKSGNFNLDYIKAYDQMIFNLVYLNKLYP